MDHSVDSLRLFDDDFNPSREDGADDDPATRAGIEGSASDPTGAKVRLIKELEVCERLAVCRSTLRSLTDLGPKHAGRSVRYLSSDVEAYIKGLE